MSEASGVRCRPVTEPAISVLITTKDRPELLRQALESVSAQTRADFEVIICDDGGSIDVSPLLAARQDPRMRLIRNPISLGVGPANRRLYREARGRYLAHLDDDDLWGPEYLERMVAPLEQFNQVSLSFCKHQIVVGSAAVPDPARSAEGDRRWGREGLRPGIQPDMLRLATVERAVPTSHAAVVRRSALDLEDWPDWVRSSWDLWVAYLACRGGGAGHFIPERLCSYRVHPGQYSTAPSLGRVEDLAYVYRAIWEDRRTHRLGRRLAAKAAVVHAYLGVHLARLGRQQEAAKALRLSLRTCLTPAGLLAGSLLLLPPRSARSVATMALMLKLAPARLRGMWLARIKPTADAR